MMMTQLTAAVMQDDMSAEQSRSILLLNFRRAYDTVDRDLLDESLRLFQFATGWQPHLPHSHQHFSPICCERRPVPDTPGEVRYSAWMSACANLISISGGGLGVIFTAGPSALRARSARVAGENPPIFSVCRRLHAIPRACWADSARFTHF